MQGSSPREQSRITSGEKKRIRDRRAQQRLRERRQNYVEELERRLAIYEHNHDAVSRAKSPCNVTGAEQEQASSSADITTSTTSSLKNGNTRASLMWPESDCSGMSRNATHSSRTSVAPPPATKTSIGGPGGDQDQSADSGKGLWETADHLATNKATPENIALALRLTEMTTQHEHCRHLWWGLPASNITDSIARTLVPWLCFTFVVRVCPPEPRPSHLLQQNDRNPLANFIRIFLAEADMSLSDRLAVGWLIYVYSKWRCEASEAHFTRLPPFLHVTKLQTSIHHPSVVDLLPWPKLRDALIQQSTYDDGVVFFRALLHSIRFVPLYHVASMEGATYFSPTLPHRGYGKLQDWTIDTKRAPILQDGGDLAWSSLIDCPD